MSIRGTPNHVSRSDHGQIKDLALVILDGHFH